MRSNQTFPRLWSAGPGRRGDRRYGDCHTAEFQLQVTDLRTSALALERSGRAQWDEIGYLAREYIQMAAIVENRQADLQQQAGEIRVKIR